MKKRLVNEEVRRMQELAGIEPVKEAPESSIDTVLEPYKRDLLKLFMQRKRYKEDSLVHDQLKELLETIAAELGLPGNIPWMETEWSTGDMDPVKAYKYMRDEFEAVVEDSLEDDNDIDLYPGNMGDEMSAPTSMEEADGDELSEASIDREAIEDMVLDIADYAGSGAGMMRGIEYFKDEIRGMIGSLKGNPKSIKALSKALENYIQQSEGWSQEDIELLNSYGLSLDIEVEDDDYLRYDS